MKIAFLTIDNREHTRQYGLKEPFFGTAPEALLQGFAQTPEVEIHVVSCTQQPMISPEKLAANIYFHSVVVPKIGWMKTGFQGCIRAVRNKLRAIQPDVVHGQGTERDCAMSALFSGFPNILTIHGNMRLIAQVNRARPLSYNWLAARLERYVLPRTDGVVCITNYTRQAVAALARKTWLLPNAVDESFFGVSAMPDQSTPPVGLCVGAICYRKNQNAFIRALDSLAKTKPFKILFLGQVAADAYGREFMQLIGERKWCEYVGWAGREELRQHFQKATFLVLPTLEDNCPMVVLEAMAAGVPSLASKVGGVPDLITHERTGLFCDPQNPESFSAGVARLLDDSLLAAKLSETGRMEALQRFHPRVIAQRHLEIYREVKSQ